MWIHLFKLSKLCRAVTPDSANMEPMRREDGVTIDDRSARIILLNGTTSAGKSTLARAIQRRLDPQPVLTGLDAFVFPSFPPAWNDTPTGCLFEKTPDGAVHLRLGPGGIALTKAFHPSVAAMANEGLSVIVDDCLFEPWLLQDWLDVLSGHHITFVGVYCDLAEAERRELQRGDRQIGQVLGQIGQVHLHGDYDISVDTTAKTPSQCADEVVQALKSGVGATAFDRLRRNSLGRRGSQNPSKKPASERTMI